MNANPVPIAASDGPVVAWLAARRRVLLVIYLLALAGFVLAISLVNVGVYVEFGHAVFGWLSGEQFRWGQVVRGITWFDWWFALALAIFLVTQAALIWGGGRIRLARDPARFRSIGVAIFVVSFFAMVLTVGLLLLAMEFADWREAFLFPSLRTLWPYLLGGIWAFWFLAAWLYARGRAQTRVLGRFLAIVFAGSWIEFMLALPIDIAARNRETCHCAIGSAWVLLVTVPLMLWAVGPALYLLYLRERRAEDDLPGRARRILQRKTRRGPVRAAGEAS